MTQELLARSHSQSLPGSCTTVPQPTRHHCCSEWSLHATLGFPLFPHDTLPMLTLDPCTHTPFQANQRLFREMGYIQQLPRVLTTATTPASDPSSATADNGDSAGPVPANGSANWGAAMGAAAGAMAAGVAGLRGTSTGAVQPIQISRQKASILLCALESVQLLVAAPAPVHTSTGPDAPSTGQAQGKEAGKAGNSPEAVNRLSSQMALVNGGLIQALLPLCLAMGGVSSTAVRAQVRWYVAVGGRMLADVLGVRFSFTLFEIVVLFTLFEIACCRCADLALKALLCAMHASCKTYSATHLALMQALESLADLVQGCPQGQAALGSASVVMVKGVEVPVLQVRCEALLN